MHKWVCSTNKGVGRAIDKKYLQMKSPEPLVQNHNNFTEMVPMLPSSKIDQKVQLGRTTWLQELKIEISLSHIIFLRHMPIHHIPMCLDSEALWSILFIQIFRQFQNIDFCETYKQHYVRWIIVKFEQFSPSSKKILFTTTTPCNAQFQFLTAWQGINLLSKDQKLF